MDRVLRLTVSEIRVRFDEELLPLLGDSPEEIERQALEMIVLELYRRHTLSAGRAATLLGKKKFAFIRWTGELGIPYFDLSADELREELRVLEKATLNCPSRQSWLVPMVAHVSVIGLAA
jgi:predicted HTH domain antitoxin